ncbi:LLM class flavin-dependent oxidoreductase [Pseudogemmobacter sonorensis]|uniref:LLM class flavin-dependent oxidoreductase n=1 Tax=Pseudogemmobacter sonorensis TaxID=2989681 RepID=UPI0036A1C7F1
MAAASKKMMRLGLSMRYHGYHKMAWRHPDVPASAVCDINYFIQDAKRAEAAKFDMIFFADGLAVRANDTPKGFLSRDGHIIDLEPLTMLSAISQHTSKIGLVATASTTYNEPFHIARKFNSLDHISGGRAGWNVVTSWSEQEAWNFNRDRHLDYDTRYERADEFVEVVKGLWHSWEEDTFLFDQEAGVYFDDARMHVLNHVGKHFKVRGPLTSPRSPQGYPVIVQAGASKGGLHLAGKYAEVIYANHDTIPDAVNAYNATKSHLDKFGRDWDSQAILPGIAVYVAKTRAEAQAKYDAMLELVDEISGRGNLSIYMGDMSNVDLDAPLPDDISPTLRSYASLHQNMAKREKMTVRELYRHMAGSGGSYLIIGTAEDVADKMQEWFEAGGADGFNVCPPYKPGSIEDFCEFVVPELQRRGLFKTEYQGATFRERLHLPPVA